MVAWPANGNTDWNTKMLAYLAVGHNTDGTHKEVFNVRDYGAVGNGVTDDTAAFVACIAAIATAGSGVMFIPSGDFLITSEILIITDGTWIEGAGQKVSFITFNTAGTLFKFADSGSTIVGCGMSKLSIVDTESTSQKIAIELEDVDHFNLKHISILWGESTGDNCVGLQTNGAYALIGSDLIFNVDSPIQFKTEKGALGIDLDHVHFQDLTLIGWDANPIVEVTEGVQLHNLTFDGDQGWGRGTHGFYWDDATSPGNSLNLALKNIRWEGSSNAAGYTVYINPGSALYNCTLENIFSGSGADYNGYYFRGDVISLTMKNCSYAGTAVALDMDESIRPVILDNCLFVLNGTVNVGNLVKVYDSGRMNDVGGTISPYVIYDKLHAQTAYPSFGATINVTGIIHSSPGTLADEATPSVAHKNWWVTGGTTTITDLDDTVTGQVVNILCLHSLTFDFTTAQDADHNLDGSSANITADTGDVLKFYSENGTTLHLISYLDASADNN